MKLDKNNKKQEIIHKYNQTSEFYDRRYMKIQQEKYNLILQDKLIDEKLVLDAGCGTGLLYGLINNSIDKSININFQYVGVDISINMLKRFSSKLNQKAKNLNLILTDLENLPFRKDTFTLLFSFTSLQNLPDLNRGLEESIRVVKNGAEVNFSILKKKISKKRLEILLEPHLKPIKIIDFKSIEDILFTGIALKE